MSKRTRTGGYINGFPGDSDRKFKDVSMPAAAVAATPTVHGQGYTVITQGAGNSQRVGRRCCVKTIQVRSTITFAPGTDAHAGALVHFWMVQDTQSNGAVAAFGDIFSRYDGGAIAAGDAGRVMRNLEYVERFKILKHWVFRFQPTATNIAGTEHNTTYQAFEDFLNVNIPLDYSGATGAIGELRKNNIVLYGGVVGLGATSNVTTQGTIRLRYAD